MLAINDKEEVCPPYLWTMPYPFLICQTARNM
jgi:hypothetical protein